MTHPNQLKAAFLLVIALAIAAMGFYVANADDAPGAALMGLLLMIAGVILAVKVARNRLPAWAARTALAAGILIAAFAVFLTHAVTVAAPLFAATDDVPSVVGVAPAPRYAAAVERARANTRAAIREQNLPGVSVAVAAAGHVIWAEGFGWRDVATETPMTSDTRFNIGTAAPEIGPVSAAVSKLDNTGAERAEEWSPEHVGEPEEDFPLFTLVRRLVFQPLGLAPAEPLPGNRATFYVPRDNNDPRRGRRLMYMRDLACCAGTLAFYSTAPDLARLVPAHARSFDGQLAGGTVMSLVAPSSTDVIVVVLSNISHADTAGLARTIADAFATDDAGEV